MEHWTCLTSQGNLRIFRRKNRYPSSYLSSLYPKRKDRPSMAVSASRGVIAFRKKSECQRNKASTTKPIGEARILGHRFSGTLKMLNDEWINALESCRKTREPSPPASQTRGMTSHKPLCTRIPSERSPPLARSIDLTGANANSEWIRRRRAGSLSLKE